MGKVTTWDPLIYPIKVDGILYLMVYYIILYHTNSDGHVCGFHCEIMLNLGVHDQLITATIAAQSPNLHD